MDFGNHYPSAFECSLKVQVYYQNDNMDIIKIMKKPAFQCDAITSTRTETQNF